MIYERKIKVVNPQNWNHHRHGWKEVISEIKKNLENPCGIELHPNIEIEALENIIVKKPWIGIIHNVPKHPEHVKKFYGNDMSNDMFFQTQTWKQSKKKCKGLIVLSEYVEKHIKDKTKIQIKSLFHPTNFDVKKFDINKFVLNNNKKILMIGHWLRNFWSFNKLKTKKYEKVLLKGADFLYDQIKLDNVKYLERLDNESYDELISKNIVFLDLFDSSANNIIMECISRNTPILVKKLPAIVEYLGEEYPFYFNTLEEAEEKIEDNNYVNKSYDYLLNMKKNKFTYNYFIESLVKTKIYSDIKINLHI